MGAEHSRMYSGMTLAPVATGPMKASGNERLLSPNLATEQRLIMTRPLHGWHSHGASVHTHGKDSAGGTDSPAPAVNINGVFQQAANYVYDISGHPLLAVQPRNHGKELAFVHADGQEAFCIHKTHETIMYARTVQLFTKGGELVCDGRRINHLGGKSAKFGLFLPGQEQAWIIIKSDSERDDLFVFIGNPKEGGQLIARIHKRPRLDGFHTNDITAKEADTFFDCRLAPGVDWAVMVAIVLLTDSHAASGEAAM